MFVLLLLILPIILIVYVFWGLNQKRKSYLNDRESDAEMERGGLRNYLLNRYAIEMNFFFNPGPSHLMLNTESKLTSSSNDSVKQVLKVVNFFDSNRFSTFLIMTVNAFKLLINDES